MESKIIDAAGTSVEKWMEEQMQRHTGWSVVVGFMLPVVLVAAGAAEEPPSLDRLAFMVGHWVGSSPPVEMEELWTAAKGGMMLGVHRDVPMGRGAFFEFLRIEERADAIVYIASPKGIGTTEFVLVAIDEIGVIFENLDHDFPQRIIYRLQGDRLKARIEGEVEGELKSSEWVWKRAECSRVSNSRGS